MTTCPNCGHQFDLTDCDRQECTYYTHYLAYGPPHLTHEGFHAAEKHCEYWQKKALATLDNDQDVPPTTERQCRYWEQKVRA